MFQKEQSTFFIVFCSAVGQGSTKVIPRSKNDSLFFPVIKFPLNTVSLGYGQYGLCFDFPTVGVC